MAREEIGEGGSMQGDTFVASSRRSSSWGLVTIVVIVAILSIIVACLI